MRTKSFVKGLLFASVLPFCSLAVANDDNTTPKEEQIIEFSNQISTQDEKALQVPVTATLNNGVVNVQFTGNVPMATVTVNNALTGTTVSQQTMSATAGTISTIPVAGLSWGNITVTNNVSGASVSGNFNVE
ncbi:MAG: DUF3244 domain-containing protein [Bacteroidaceae bacterium]|nr:DUF3244 domain-containing protein [Bacteroidaceae bacterium]